MPYRDVLREVVDAARRRRARRARALAAGVAGVPRGARVARGGAHAAAGSSPSSRTPTATSSRRRWRASACPFELAIVASEIGSYKPALGHWRAFEERVGRLPDVHVAASHFHDVVPASTLGVPTVWINRLGESVRAAADARASPTSSHSPTRSMSSSPDGLRAPTADDAEAIAALFADRRSRRCARGAVVARESDVRHGERLPRPRAGRKHRRLRRRAPGGRSPLRRLDRERSGRGRCAPRLDGGTCARARGSTASSRTSGRTAKTLGAVCGRAASRRSARRSRCRCRWTMRRPSRRGPTASACARVQRGRGAGGSRAPRGGVRRHARLPPDAVRGLDELVGSGNASGSTCGSWPRPAVSSPAPRSASTSAPAHPGSAGSSRSPSGGRGAAAASGRRCSCTLFASWRVSAGRRAGLSVQADNPTGAVRLYESVGMRPVSRRTIYEKRLDRASAF